MPENATDLEAEARAEANVMKHGVFIDGNPFSDVVDAWTDGFTEGAAWGARRPFTDAEVEVACLAYAGGEMTPEEWEWVKTQPDVVQPYLDGMRAALDAITKTRAGMLSSTHKPDTDKEN